MTDAREDRRDLRRASGWSGLGARHTDLPRRSRLASPQRGQLEGAVQLGGNSCKHGLQLEILYTAGDGGHLDGDFGAVDIGLSRHAGDPRRGAEGRAGPHHRRKLDRLAQPVLVRYGGFARPVDARRERPHHRLFDHGLDHQRRCCASSMNTTQAKPVATGDVSATIPRVMTRQIDVGWSVAPFNLKPLEDEIRIVDRATTSPPFMAEPSRCRSPTPSRSPRRRTRSRRCGRPIAKPWTGCT